MEEHISTRYAYCNLSMILLKHPKVSLYEQNLQQTFFGDHYKELLTIKDEYDPASLFVVAEGVGSERWDHNLECPITQNILD